MTTTTILEAAAREGKGKGAARELRRRGQVPGIIYGKDKECVQVSLDGNKLMREYVKPGFFSHLIDLKVGKDSYRVLARDVQLHPVSDKPEHVDFQLVDKNTKVRVFVAVHFLNQDKSPGIKRGGVLNIVRREVELLCSPESIPEFLEVNLEGKEIGDSIHISHIALPAGVAPTITDRDFTVATIAGRMAEEDLSAPPVAAPMPGADGEEGAAAEGDKAADAKAGDAKKAEAAPKKEGK